MRLVRVRVGEPRRLGSVLLRLSGVEIFEVNEVTRAPRRPLHHPEMLQRTDRDRHTGHLELDRLRLQLGIGQYAFQALNDIEIADVGGNEGSPTAVEQRRDGALGSEQGRVEMDASAQVRDEVRQPVEILGCGIGHDVTIIRPSQHTPRA